MKDLSLEAMDSDEGFEAEVNLLERLPYHRYCVWCVCVKACARACVCVHV